MARRDISGAVDFGYLEGFAAGDSGVVDEVLELFREQAALWTPMLDPSHAGWRDAVHTVKGARVRDPPSVTMRIRIAPPPPPCG